MASAAAHDDVETWPFPVLVDPCGWRGIRTGRGEQPTPGRWLAASPCVASQRRSHDTPKKSPLLRVKWTSSA